jgi:alanine dehydrogenase
MIIGIPREIKEHEYRVGITPSGARSLRDDGHTVMVEASAGEGSGFTDEEYMRAGAVVTDKSRLFRESGLIVKVKEPMNTEYQLFQENQALFTFLHLAPNRELTGFLLRKRIAAFAYETLEEDGVLPLLMPMSEIAGKMAPVVAAYYLQRVHGGTGMLLTAVSGAPSARLLIIGAGNAGMSALGVAYGMGSDITVINRGEERLKRIDELYGGNVKTLLSTADAIESEVIEADAVICAVLVAGASTPRLISRSLVSRMKRGAVIVDISVDQGGSAETTRPTTHNDPVYAEGGVIHYAVSNMPGAYPRTSTQALTARTMPYIRELAGSGIGAVIRGNPVLRSSLNTFDGKIMHKAVAKAYGLSGDE